jgi:hypothetical protein
VRGEFRFRNGLIVPNNVSLVGAQAVLESAFNLTARTWYVALVSGPPTLDMTMADMIEPTIGTNGYARQALTHDDTGWPTIGVSNDQAYVESALVTFEATGGAFDEAIQRCALLGTATHSPTDDVWSLSSPLPLELTIDESTDLADRQFNYRLYL